VGAAKKPNFFLSNLNEAFNIAATACFNTKSKCTTEMKLLIHEKSWIQ